MIPASIFFPLLVITTAIVYILALKWARQAQLSPRAWLYLIAGTAFVAGMTSHWMLTEAIQFLGRR